MTDTSNAPAWDDLKRQNIRTMEESPPEHVAALRHAYPREWLVLQRISQGETYRTIARDLNVTPGRARQLAAQGARRLRSMEWRTWRAEPLRAKP